PQAAGALRLHLAEAELALVAGLGGVDPDGLRRHRGVVAPRRPHRPIRPSPSGADPGRAAGPGDRRLQRVPVRSGGGAPFLAEPHLIIAAVVAGAATLSIAAAVAPLQNTEADPSVTLWPLLFLSLVAHGFLVGLEVFNRHAVHDATLAARLIRRGPYRARFWV